MNMKTVNIYFYNYGENSYTAMTPCRPAQPEDGDTYDTRCIAYDNDGLITVKVGEVRPVDMPDELDPSDYCRNSYDFDTMWTTKGAKELPYAWQKELVNRIGIGARRDVCLTLLTTNIRSPFRQSLKDQLVKWLEEENHQYPQPFSPAQWGALLKYTR